ncbi:MAG: hypothetical protein JKX85_11930 [Phycisphaeraceae bacterium]|nr:hypothetical protein [Phycisphaeraceae bacterium]
MNKGLASGATGLVKLAAGFASVSAAIAVATRAFSQFEDMQKQAAQRVQVTALGRGAFRQIANDQSEMKKLNTFSDNLRKRGFTEEQAARTTFSAGSAGMDTFVKGSSLNTYEQLLKTGFTPESAISATQKAQANFGGSGAGKTGGGSFRQNINKVLAAAGPSPVMASRIAESASVAAEIFAAIGGQDEELLALVGVLSEATKSPEQASEKVKSLSDQLRKKKALGLIDLSGRTDLVGMDLIDALPTLAKEGRLKTESGDAVGVEKFLSESQAIQGLGLIQKQRGKITDRIVSIKQAEAQTGTKKDLLTVKSGLGSTKMKIADQQRKQNETRLLSEEEQFGNARQGVDLLLAENKQKRLNQNMGWLRRGASVSAEFTENTLKKIMGGFYPDYDFNERYIQEQFPDSQENKKLRRNFLDVNNKPGLAYTSEEQTVLKAMQSEVEKLGPSLVEQRRHRDPLNDFERMMFRINNPGLNGMPEGFITSAMQRVNQQQVPQRVFRMDQLRAQGVPENYLNRFERAGGIDIDGDPFGVRSLRSSAREQSTYAESPQEREARSTGAKIRAQATGVAEREARNDELVQKLLSVAKSMEKAAANLDSATRDAQRKKISANRNNN